MKKFILILFAVFVVFTTVLIIWKYDPSQSPVYSDLFVDKNLQMEKSYKVGAFQIQWDGKKGQLLITQDDYPEHELFKTAEGIGFLAAGKGDLTVEEKRAHFTMKEKRVEICDAQYVNQIMSNENKFTIKGNLNCSLGGQVGYVFTLKVAGDKGLHYSFTLDDPSYNRTYLSWNMGADAHVFGFGEQYSSFDMRGKRLPILVQEQGVGRGLQPLTSLADITNGAGGHWYSTYAPVPHFISSGLQSMYSENKEYQVFHFEHMDKAQLETFANHSSGYIYAGSSPQELVEAHTSFVGRMQALPNWTQDGLILGVQGGTEKVLEKVNTLLEQDIPISAVWIQDWVGKRETSFGSQLWWNWELDQDHYNNWETFTNELKEKNIKLLGYINPFLVNSDDKENRKRDLYREALQSGYFVKDANEQPIAVEITDFSASLIDLTNPEAVKWFKEIIKEELIDNGFSGWMADFGEGLPFDVVMDQGAIGEEFHNAYPVAWAKLNKEVLQESNLGDEGMFFLRAGYSESPSYASSFWLGDQLMSWDKHDGIKTVIPGLISSGLSGYGINHSDTGGYTGLNYKPFLSYSRSEELLLRWIELNAFTPLFRSHEGNRPEESVQLYSNENVLAQTKKFTDIYATLAPYRENLMKEMEETGAPLVRPLFYHYPNDPNTFDIKDEFLLGKDLLVAPVLDKDKEKSAVYLPAGEWVHVWTGDAYSIEQGKTIKIASPIGEPPVFYRANSKVETLLSGMEGQVN